MMENPETKRAKMLTEMSRKDLRVAIRILTGMCCFKAHLYKINDKSCRYCQEQEETMLHIDNWQLQQA